jgi:hypothetical protein
MPSSEMLRLVALVRTDVLEERIASIVTVTKISALLVTLMAKAVCSSVTSVLTRATLRHIPEDGILQKYHC